MHIKAIKAYDPNKSHDEQINDKKGWISWEPTEEEFAKYGPDPGYSVMSPLEDKWGLYYFDVGLRIEPKGRTIKEIGKSIRSAIEQLG